MQNILKIIIVILAGMLAMKYFNKQNNKTYGTVIILNGPSSSGKSSIQKDFQYLMMQEPTKLWIKLGIDNLFDKPMPDITMENLAFWQSPNAIRWVESTKDPAVNSVITLFTGQEGEKVAYGMNSAIADYAKAGCNVIVDYIAYKKEWLEDLKSKLQGIKTIWVKVDIPLDVLEEREASRGTSPKGHARSHYDSVYWNIVYDYVVYPAVDSAQQIAVKLKSLL